MKTTKRKLCQIGKSCKRCKGKDTCLALKPQTAVVEPEAVAEVAESVAA